jgi:hypothetical protein
MNLDAQRIGIAEACGIVSKDQWGNLYRTPHGIVRDCPDYLNDLNAMHEAEKVLTKDQDLQYHLTLTKVVTGYALPEFFGSVIQASAEQRAKAFLRTIGKWEDAK